jgi:hypothetical protein
MTKKEICLSDTRDDVFEYLTNFNSNFFRTHFKKIDNELANLYATDEKEVCQKLINITEYESLYLKKSFFDLGEILGLGFANKMIFSKNSYIHKHADKKTFELNNLNSFLDVLKPDTKYVYLDCFQDVYGFEILDLDFLKEVYKICEERNIKLILNETSVMCFNIENFAFHKAKIKPFLIIFNFGLPKFYDFYCFASNFKFKTENDKIPISYCMANEVLSKYNKPEMIEFYRLRKYIRQYLEIIHQDHPKIVKEQKFFRNIIAFDILDGFDANEINVFLKNHGIIADVIPPNTLKFSLPVHANKPLIDFFYEKVDVSFFLYKKFMG